MKKVALIAGITMPDSSFLSEFLIDVHGIIRRVSYFNASRIKHLYLLTTTPFVYPTIKC
ncbi:hypothetical protein [Fluviicola sp.]|uniref:hypothetical protein n=1 Tax=Fluviicola sp. TaxID=1917219 RepID=UPI003D2E5AEF